MSNGASNESHFPQTGEPQVGRELSAAVQMTSIFLSLNTSADPFGFHSINSLSLEVSQPSMSRSDVAL